MKIGLGLSPCSERSRVWKSRGSFTEGIVSPEKNPNIWILVSGGLLGVWTAMLSYVLRAFGQRMDRIEASVNHQNVPKTECGFFRENTREILREIKNVLAENNRDIQHMNNTIVKIATKMEALDE
ncbi:MAG: hypothetical protein ACE5DW_00760 [Thermodesulfobacteriota bacterium]